MTDDDIPETPEEWFKSARLRMPKFYRLVGKQAMVCDGDPMSFAQAYADRAAAFRDGQPDPWRVGLTEVGGGRSISTVFLGLDHRFFGDGPPLLFETMMFPGCEMIGRCSTWDEAEEMHERAVAEARRLRVVK